MDGRKQRFVRLQNNNTGMVSESVFEVESSGPISTRKGLEEGSKRLRTLSTFFQLRHSKVHAEGFESKNKKIFDPRGKAWLRWNSVFLFSCLAALFIDPLFFYLPVVNSSKVCLSIDSRLAIVITVLRTITDIFHLVHIGVLFRTGFIITSSNALGRRELVSDPVKIAKRYLSRHFILDFVAVLPLPQIVIWLVIPAMQGTAADNTKNALRLIILIQLIPRIYPLTQELGKSSSKILTDTAWGGAAYNLLLYMLISHSYVQSITLRLEEMRLKRQDMEQWMQHRQIYPELRGRIRSYEQYKWLETRGVNEEELVQVLPKDLRRDIKRHLCLTLVKGVPLFASMDEQLLDAICERLQPTLFTSGTNVVQEGDPVNEMLFIIRGDLKSVTTNGGRTGFLNEGKLEPGHFCGEELLTWALDPKSSGHFPSSTRSVTAENEVEAFALKAEDLKFVANQFRRLHSKQVQHTFRHYSQQWQTWAACSIQAAWRRYKRRKLAELRQKEEDDLQIAMQKNSSSLGHVSLGTALFASRFAANAMRGVHRMRGLHAAEESRASLKLQKPSEPDFSAEDGD
eukprot:c24595_g1_i3 orf=228-1937(+)